jgi:hypothetical protein
MNPLAPEFLVQYPCYFCGSPCPFNQNPQTLCQICFDKALKLVKMVYHDDNVAIIAKQHPIFDGGDILTFRYTSKKHKECRDFTGAQIIICDGEKIRRSNSRYSQQYIHLSIKGSHQIQWKQAGI